MDDNWCPYCGPYYGGDPTHLGQLGNLTWLRCRDCGAEWYDSEVVETETITVLPEGRP